MTPPNRIIGIVLVRNEEHFVSWSIRSVVGFCDELIVLDNLSTDRTGAELAALARAHPNIVVHPCEDATRSHDYVEDYAGRPVWVFGVDGDEVYDAAGLARLRPRVLNGEFDHVWRMDGHVLHATRVDVENGVAEGYATPEAVTLTKFYNFGALESWREAHMQRLHGKGMVYREGFTGSEARSELDQPWDTADFRCLHLCFFPRSSADSVRPAKRANPGRLAARGLRKLHLELKNFAARPFSKDVSSKLRKYARGPVVQRDISAFGRPSDHADVNGTAAAAEEVLGRTWLEAPRP